MNYVGELRWIWVERQRDAFGTTLTEKIRVLQQFGPDHKWHDVPEVTL